MRFWRFSDGSWNDLKMQCCIKRSIENYPFEFFTLWLWEIKKLSDLRGRRRLIERTEPVRVSNEGAFWTSIADRPRAVRKSMWAEPTEFGNSTPRQNSDKILARTDWLEISTCPAVDRDLGYGKISTRSFVLEKMFEPKCRDSTSNLTSVRRVVITI